MLRCRQIERKQKCCYGTREAILAGCLIHLKPGDLLSASPRDSVASHLGPESENHVRYELLLPDSTFAGRLLLCAATAKGTQAAGTDHVILAFTQAGSFEQDWQVSMRWAQESKLPLLLVCDDSSGAKRTSQGRPSQQVFDFETLNSFAKKTMLPMFPVDGEDAMAVYRVMQECTLRARFGGGPAVLWAFRTPVSADLPTPKRSALPLARLERYMAANTIPLK